MLIHAQIRGAGAYARIMPEPPARLQVHAAIAIMTGARLVVARVYAIYAQQL